MMFAALVVATLLAAPPRPEPGPRRGPDAGARRPSEPAERTRKALEPSPPGPSLPLDVEEQPLVMSLRDRMSECHTNGWSKVRAKLLALQNTSQVMSLEIWGDREVYRPGDRVMFHMRSPRGVYVTLWWIGPEGHIVVAMDNARVPAERNVIVDTGGIVVPPLGREQWVAIATLEPVPLGCRSETAMLMNIDRRVGLEHGIGRWDVLSAE